MNCFEVMCQVLEEEYAQIPGSEAERDAQVSAALERLSAHYLNVSVNGPGDYKDRATRFAYIYGYTTCHANLVYSAINTSQPLSDLFDRPSVELACIGGGPGSDYLGILKYLMVHGKKPKLRCNLFDREPAWMESWSDVDRKVEAELQLSLPFVTFDVTVQEQWQPYTKYYRSDLFTFIYFLSEVVKYEPAATPYFANLMQRASPGALFLFVDNNASDHYGWFDRMAATNGLTILQSGNGSVKMPWDEEKCVLGRFLAKFRSPRLVANIALRVAQKPGGGTP